MYMSKIICLNLERVEMWPRWRAFELTFFHGHTKINNYLQNNYENNLKTNRLTFSTTEDTKKEPQ